MTGGSSSWIQLCQQWGFHQETQRAAALGRAAPARGDGMVLAARAAKLARALGRKFLFLLSLFQVGTDTAWDRARHVSGWHHAKHLHANVSNLTKLSLSHQQSSDVWEQLILPSGAHLTAKACSYLYSALSTSYAPSSPSENCQSFVPVARYFCPG